MGGTLQAEGTIGTKVNCKNPKCLKTGRVSERYKSERYKKGQSLRIYEKMSEAF